MYGDEFYITEKLCKTFIFNFVHLQNHEAIITKCLYTHVMDTYISKSLTNYIIHCIPLS